MSKWTLVVLSGGIVSKKILDTNSCLDYLENNISQDVEIISIQEEEDDNVHGIVNNIDCVKTSYDARGGEALDDICNNNDSGSETEYEIIVSEEDRSNTTPLRGKPLLSQCISKKPKAFWTNRITNVEDNASIESLIDSNIGIPNKHVLDFEVNPSKPLGKYQCFLCPLNYAQKSYLSKHLLKHFDFCRPFMCPVCEKTFPRIEDLHKHINCSADFRAYHCNQCDKSFRAYYLLWKHKRNTHSGKSPYKCTECDYKTFERTRINDHMATHRDERPFKCKYCTYASKSSRYLISHERIHTDDKRYKCDLCFSSFVQSKALRYHRKTHFWNGNKRRN